MIADSRFVDDTFVILKSDIVKRFFSHINSIEASIKFTIEYEKEDKLPFLDILVMKKKKKVEHWQPKYIEKKLILIVI